MGFYGCASRVFNRSLASQSYGSFFTNSKNQSARFISSTKGVDRILKAADPVFDLSLVIAQGAGASEATLGDIAKGRSAVKTTRDVMGLFNIFQGRIPDLYTHTLVSLELYRDLSNEVNSPKPTQLLSESAIIARKKDNRPIKYHETAETFSERVIALISNIFRGGGSLTMIAAFGVCRPIANFEKYIRQVDPSVSRIGKAFPSVMMANHACGGIGHTAEIIFQQLAFERAMDREVDGSRQGKIREEHDKMIVNNTLAVTQNALEFTNDIANIFGPAAPVWFRIPLGLSIGAVGIWRTWRTA